MNVKAQIEDKLHCQSWYKRRIKEHEPPIRYFNQEFRFVIREKSVTNRNQYDTLPDYAKRDDNLDYVKFEEIEKSPFFIDWEVIIKITQDFVRLFCERRKQDNVKKFRQFIYYEMDVRSFALICSQLEDPERRILEDFSRDDVQIVPAVSNWEFLNQLLAKSKEESQARVEKCNHF